MLIKDKIILGISGGPDSMFLYNKLKNKYGKEKIIIAHFNHKFRKQSDKEENFLKNFFEKEKVNFKSGKYDGNNFKENILRKARYDFFKSIGWGKYYLALGHNLTDRIETSLINISRGTGIKGFLNMKIIDKKRKIYRPLLNLTKKEIQNQCDKLKIPYFIDETNFDNNVSKRNFIRNEILNKLENEFGEQFFYNFEKIYNQIEKLLPEENIGNYLEQVEENKYIFILPKKNKEYFIRELLEKFEVYDFRSKVINEIIDYIENAKGGGFKQYGNLLISKKKRIIYVGFIEK